MSAPATAVRSREVVEAVGAPPARRCPMDRPAASRRPAKPRRRRPARARIAALDAGPFVPRRDCPRRAALGTQAGLRRRPASASEQPPAVRRRDHERGPVAPPCLPSAGARAGPSPPSALMRSATVLHAGLTPSPQLRLQEACPGTDSRFLSPDGPRPNCRLHAGADPGSARRSRRSHLPALPSDDVSEATRSNRLG